jgi:hypothetical protein
MLQTPECNMSHIANGQKMLGWTTSVCNTSTTWVMLQTIERNMSHVLMLQTVGRT